MSQNSFDYTPILLKEFDRNGMMLRPATLNKLVKRSTAAISFEDFKADIANIISQIKALFLRNPSMETSVLDENILEEAFKMIEISEKVANTVDHSRISELIKSREETSLIVLNAFTEFPQISESKVSEGVLGSADDKISSQIKRYLRIREKLLKNPAYLFENKRSSKMVQENVIEKPVMDIVEIGTLVGSLGQKMIFGVLIELDLGNYYLQDLYSKVRLDLTSCQPAKGFICIGNAYIIAGEYKSEAFKVLNFILPEIETRSQSTENKDVFGADSKFLRLYGEVLNLEVANQNFAENMNGIEVKAKKKIEKLVEKNLAQQVFLGCIDLKKFRNDEANFKNNSVAVFSSFLFSPERLAKFENVLKGFEQNQPPLVFVLMGEFSLLTEIRDAKDYKEYHQNIDLFLKIVQKFQKITQLSAWLFVPSTSDLGLSVLPREGLPSFIYEKIRKVLPLSFNCSNPCRAKILGKEFQFNRNDLVKELRRNAIIQVDSSIEIEQAFTDTVLSQYYLSPVSQYSQPVYWKYDQCLAVDKMPNFMILGEGFCRQFERRLDEEEDGSFIVSPGNWGKHSGFAMVYPLLNVVQICKV